jgi:hypothetical protein
MKLESHEVTLMGFSQVICEDFHLERIWKRLISGAFTPFSLEGVHALLHPGGYSLLPPGEGLGMRGEIPNDCFVGVASLAMTTASSGVASLAITSLLLRFANRFAHYI